MSKELKDIISVSGTTILSRITGLLRDVLIIASLGASIWSSAFLLGFTLPNLFRRLFGEGALTSAFIPIFSSIHKEGGATRANLFFNRFFLRWFLYLLIFVVLSHFLILWSLNFDFLSFRWAEALKLLDILLPYIILVCLAAMASGALNVFGRFFAPAAAPIVFNLCLIVFILIGMFTISGERNLVIWLCYGVIFGGIFQLLVPLYELLKEGWKPRLIFSLGDQKKGWSDFWALFTPSILGAAVLQINVLISRLLAYSLEDSAVSLLYISSRLMELSLGIFTIAIVTVFFPAMARAHGDDAERSFESVFYKGFRLMILIVVPASLGLILLSKPILITLFQWGSFVQSDVLQTVPILIIFALSLPFYSMATYFTRAFYAQKNMKTPVRISIYVLLINTTLSLVLMRSFGVSGLALANLLSSIAFSYLLQSALRKQYQIVALKGIQSIRLPMFNGLIFISSICLLGQVVISLFELNTKIQSILALLTLIPLSALFYFYLLNKYNVTDITFLKSYLSRK